VTQEVVVCLSQFVMSRSSKPPVPRANSGSSDGKPVRTVRMEEYTRRHTYSSNASRMVSSTRTGYAVRVCHGRFARRSYSAAIDIPCVEQLSIVQMGMREEVVRSGVQTRANSFKVRSVGVECACPLSVVIRGFRANQLRSSPHALSEEFHCRSVVKAHDMSRSLYI
jgi:hypothetical protein